MLTKFAAALLATSLIAGSAIAAQPSGPTNAPAAQSQSSSAPAAITTKAGKTVKHTARHRHHVRNHVARVKSHVVTSHVVKSHVVKSHVARHARHAKPATTHQAAMSNKRS